MTADEVVKRLAISIEKGRDTGEAASHLQKPNRLPEGKKRGPVMRFLSQFHTGLRPTRPRFHQADADLWIDAAIIFSAVILNALLGFIQEGRAEKALDSIRNMLSAEARTVRGGATGVIPGTSWYPGT